MAVMVVDMYKRMKAHYYEINAQTCRSLHEFCACTASATHNAGDDVAFKLLFVWL